MDGFAENIVAAYFFTVFYISLVGYIDYFAVLYYGGKHADNIRIAYVVLVAKNGYHRV